MCALSVKDAVQYWRNDSWLSYLQRYKGCPTGWETYLHSRNFLIYCPRFFFALCMDCTCMFTSSITNGWIFTDKGPWGSGRLFLGSYFTVRGHTYFTRPFVNWYLISWFYFNPRNQRKLIPRGFYQLYGSYNYNVCIIHVTFWWNTRSQ